MTLDEKASLTAGVDFWHTAAIPRLGIPAVRLTDGPNGARGDTEGFLPITPSVCIPSATALGATWDPDLVAEASAAVARQARDKGARVLLAPTVNLHRHPLWGRNFEAFSEDPILTAKLAVAYIRGVSEQGVIATVKHLVGNETEFERYTSSSVIDERTLRELYLLPFEHAVRVAGVLALMTSYNRVNGRHVPDQPRFLTGILRQEWGFPGLVMTDWFGLSKTEEAARAGLDLEMPGPARSSGPRLAEAVRSGRVEESLLDAAVARILGVFDRVGALDDPPLGEERPVDRPEDHTLTRRAAAAAMVLLTNRGVLPLARGGLRRVAVLGANADRPAITGGGSARVQPFYRLSPLAALRDRLGAAVDVVHEAGTGPGGVDRAVELARGADLAVLVVGTDDEWESEGYDRETMDLPPGQDQLVTRVTDANPRSVVVVNSGSPVGMPWADAAGAVLQAWFAGQEYANGLVDVLLGEVRSRRPPPHHPAAPDRAYAGLRQLPRGEQRGPLRRGPADRLPLVRGAAAAGALPLRARALLHDLRDRAAAALVPAARRRREAAHRGAGDQHRVAARLGGGPALRGPARRRLRDPAAPAPPREGAQGVRQGAPGAGRVDDGEPRAGRARLRLLRRGRRVLAGAGRSPGQPAHPHA